MVLLNKQIVEQKAKELGFDLIGFAKAELLNTEVSFLKKWLANKYNAGMSYMERNIEKRLNVKEILPSAKTVISLAVNYFVDNDFPQKNDVGKVSRYAWAKDYHYIIWEMLEKFIDELQTINKNFEAKFYVDTGPVMDKAWAVRAGIGWQGKNSNVINPEMGSWLFIATVITNYDFTPSNMLPDRCGNCTACIDACPTNAIVEPYVVDANKCISYLTIENKGEISSEFKNKLEGWIFGCDICQEVCPWNKRNFIQTKIPEFNNVKNKAIDLHFAKNLTNSGFKKEYFATPIFRAKAKGLKRNAEFISDDE